MNRSRDSSIIVFNTDGQNHFENRLKTPIDRSHNLNEAAIIELLSPLVIEAAKYAAEVDFKAILDARHSHQSDTGGN